MTVFHFKEQRSGCWEWLGARNEKGYGISSKLGQRRRAHRLMWEALRGPIPDQLTIDHLCHNRVCVNPAHMELVSMSENSARAAEWMRLDDSEVMCPAGLHPLAANRQPDGRCRACRRVYLREYAKKAKAAS